MKINMILRLLPLIMLALLLILFNNGRVDFGDGLGDILWMWLIYFGLLVYGIYFLAYILTPKVNPIFPLLSIAFCCYIILEMTFWRGRDFPWNGDILVPTQETIDEREQTAYENELAALNSQIETIPSYELRMKKGLFLSNNYKYELALAEYKEAQKLNPNSLEAYRKAARVYGHLGDKDNMLRELELAPLNPLSLNAHHRGLKDQIVAIKKECVLARQLSTLGLELQEKGRDTEAIPKFLEALRICPLYQKTHYNYGVSLMNISKYKEAILEFNTVLSYDFADHRSYHNRGKCYRELGNLEEACKDFEQTRKFGKTDVTEELTEYCH